MHWPGRQSPSSWSSGRGPTATLAGCSAGPTLSDQQPWRGASLHSHAREEGFFCERFAEGKTSPNNRGKGEDLNQTPKPPSHHKPWAQRALFLGAAPRPAPGRWGLPILVSLSLATRGDGLSLWSSRWLEIGCGDRISAANDNWGGSTGLAFPRLYLHKGKFLLLETLVSDIGACCGSRWLRVTEDPECVETHGRQLSDLPGDAFPTDMQGLASPSCAQSRTHRPLCGIRPESGRPPAPSTGRVARAGKQQHRESGEIGILRCTLILHSC